MLFCALSIRVLLLLLWHSHIIPEILFTQHKFPKLGERDVIAVNYVKVRQGRQHQQLYTIDHGHQQVHHDCQKEHPGRQKVHHDWYMTGTSVSNRRIYGKGQEIMWLQLIPFISINQSISTNQEVCCLFGVVFIILNFVPYDHCCHFYATVFPTLAFVFIAQAVLTLFSMKYTSKKINLMEKSSVLLLVKN